MNQRITQAQLYGCGESRVRFGEPAEPVSASDVVPLFCVPVWAKLKQQKASERWQPDTEVSWSRGCFIDPCGEGTVGG